MKILVVCLVSIFLSQISFSQDSLMIVRIDSIINVNEAKDVVIFKKIEKNLIETLNGRSPAKILRAYNLTPDNLLSSARFMTYSVGDTDIILNYFFDQGQLIKVNAVWFDSNKKPTQENYYFNKSQLINTNLEINGPYAVSYYVSNSKRIVKLLKKRPIRFPE